jgi:poly(A) polymerase Pap1
VPIDYLLNIKNVSYDNTNALSFSGWKTCQKLLDMIEYKDVFTYSLRIIKAWAKRRGIYGFNFGYLNGISLVIMLLKAQSYLKQDN